MKIIAIALIMIGVAHLAQADSAWHPRAGMFSKRSDMTATLVGDKIIVVGGCDSNQACPVNAEYCYCASITNKVHAYSPLDDSWEVLPVIPTPRFRHAAAAVGNQLYVFGGRDVSDRLITTVDVYNADSQTWSTLSTPWTGATSDLIGVSVGTNVYAVGGYNNDYASLATVAVLDTAATNPSFSVGSVPNTLTGRGDACAVVLDGKIVVAGGYNDVNFCSPLDTVEVFDPSKPSNGWKFAASLRNRRGDAACGVAHGLVHVLGGEQKDNATACSKYSIATQEVESLSLKSTAWKAESSLPDVRFRFAGASYQDVFYVFGGQGALDANQHQVLDTVEAWYDPNLVSAATMIPVPLVAWVAMVMIALYLLF